MVHPAVHTLTMHNDLGSDSQFSCEEESFLGSGAVLQLSPRYFCISLSSPSLSICHLPTNQDKLATRNSIVTV